MKIRVLIIDDEDEFLRQCMSELRKLEYDCIVCNNAEEGYKMLQLSMFHIVICDVLVPFQGQREGGIILAQEFSEKYPTSSIILISQYITPQWLNLFGGRANYLFLEKNDTFFDDLSNKINEIIKSKYCFVCIPFEERFQDIYELGIKSVVEKLGFTCDKSDEIQHNNDILRVIYNRIRRAYIIIADMTGQNPNVYYEVGYAHAHNKEVILLTQKVDDIPFDLRGYNHIVYKGKITLLQNKLRARIEAIFSNTS